MKSKCQASLSCTKNQRKRHLLHFPSWHHFLVLFGCGLGLHISLFRSVSSAWVVYRRLRFVRSSCSYSYRPILQNCPTSSLWLAFFLTQFFSGKIGIHALRSQPTWKINLHSTIHVGLRLAPYFNRVRNLNQSN